MCDSRRKQKWIRTPTPIPPTPPGSPSVLPEPLLDELLELWVGVGMDKQHDISLKSALDSLEFDDEDTCKFKLQSISKCDILSSET